MHDMPSVYAISDNIAMLFEGTIIEVADAKELSALAKPHRPAVLGGKRSWSDSPVAGDCQAYVANLFATLKDDLIP